MQQKRVNVRSVQKDSGVKGYSSFFKWYDVSWKGRSYVCVCVFTRVCVSLGGSVIKILNS